jgi:two-component system, chemotaxis family, protein-glutamate methylesterase/glutaminase
MTNLLIVEDSPVVQQLLKQIFSSDPDIHIMSIASTAEEGLECLAYEKPDVITMDILLPGMDGLEATRRIMETRPVPIVIVTASWEPTQAEKTFRALEAGAVAIVQKPCGPGHPDFQNMAENLVRTVKLMAGVMLVKRWLSSRSGSAAPAEPAAGLFAPSLRQIDVVALGASTGGPPVIKTILSGLASDFTIPLLVVQHMAAGFQEGMVRWLQHDTGFPISIARAGELICARHAYLAPDGFHMGAETGGRILLSRDPPERGLRPSVSFLFRSVASQYGCRAAGVLLTGMGEDGARELKMMRGRGACTIAQDGESAVVDGMPGKARELGAATHVLPPDKIVAALNSMRKVRRPERKLP